MQCNNKFQSLKNKYYVSKRKYIYILYYNINNILIKFLIYFRIYISFRLIVIEEEVGSVLSILIYLILVFESNLICIKNFLIKTYKSNIVLI